MNEKSFFLTIEYFPGMDLLKYIKQRPEKHLGEAETAKIVKQIVKAIKYMNSKGMSHRDLKPENIMIENHSQHDPLIKVIDLGLANNFRVNDMETFAGSAPYMSPEIFGGSIYSESCDMWSLGALMYELLSGQLAFKADNEAELEKKIISVDLSFNDCPVWKTISKDARLFLTECLDPISSNRMTPE